MLEKAIPSDKAASDIVGSLASSTESSYTHAMLEVIDKAIDSYRNNAQGEVYSRELTCLLFEKARLNLAGV